MRRRTRHLFEKAQEFVEFIIPLLKDFGTTAHVLSNVMIDLRGDVAFVESYISAFHADVFNEAGERTDIFAGGRYFDWFKKRYGEWCIAHRQCVFDWNQVLPTARRWEGFLFGRYLLRGTKSRADPSYQQGRSCMFEGQSIIVTGAGSGIGQQTAILLASLGARVTLADISTEGVEQTLQVILDAGGVARVQATDVSDEDSVRAMIESAIAAYGSLEGAFNNAGVEMHYKSIVELSAAEWQRVININLTGVFLCLKYEMAVMISQGRGAIVNMSSGNGIVAQANSSEYIASKFGVVGLSKAAAIEGGPHKVRVNAVCPGLIMTPMIEERLTGTETFNEILDGFKKRHVIGRFGRPNDVAEAVAWLLSEHAAFITGVALPVDGGYLAS